MDELLLLRAEVERLNREVEDYKIKETTYKKKNYDSMMITTRLRNENFELKAKVNQ